MAAAGDVTIRVVYQGQVQVGNLCFGGVTFNTRERFGFAEIDPNPPHDRQTLEFLVNNQTVRDLTFSVEEAQTLKIRQIVSYQIITQVDRTPPRREPYRAGEVYELVLQPDPQLKRAACHLPNDADSEESDHDYDMRISSGDENDEKEMGPLDNLAL